MTAEPWVSVDQIAEHLGVTRDSKFRSLDEAPEPFVYLPYEQQWRSAATLLLHYDGPAEAISAALLRELSALDASLPPPRVSSLRESTAIVLLPQRVAAGVSGALGLVGAHVLSSLLTSGATRSDWVALGTAPFYVARKLALMPAILRASKTDQEWVRTARPS